MALAALAYVDGACPDSSWRENQATGKCYKIPRGYVSAGDCTKACGSAASLACIRDDQDNHFVDDWIRTEGIPGTPRTMLWIGNYRPSTTWSACSNGDTVGYTNWSAAEPQSQNQCTTFELDGWVSRECLYWYHCLCEAGSGTSSSYEAWYAANLDAWMAPWIAKGVWTFVVGAVLGILPGLMGVCLQVRSRKAPGSWSNRVRAQVAFVTFYTGWFVMCLGFAPIIAFFVGFHAVWVIGYPQGYAALIPIGASLWLLAVDPTRRRSTHRATLFSVVFYALFALVGAAAIVFWAILSFWILGLLMGIVFLVGGVALTIVTVKALTSHMDPVSQLRRLWACMRAFFVVLFVISIALLLEYTINLASQFSENIGWVALGVSSLLCSILTRPPWRLRFCVWLSAVGKVGTDKHDAKAAALLIWVDVDPLPGSRPAAQEITTASASAS